MLFSVLAPPPRAAFDPLGHRLGEPVAHACGRAGRSASRPPCSRRRTRARPSSRTTVYLKPRTGRPAPRGARRRGRRVVSSASDAEPAGGTTGSAASSGSAVTPWRPSATATCSSCASRVPKKPTPASRRDRSSIAMVLRGGRRRVVRRRVHRWFCGRVTYRGSCERTTKNVAGRSVPGCRCS